MVLKVLNKKSAAKNVFSLIFEKPENFSFYPGQYLDYELPVDDPNGKTKSGDTRAFTISASPTEDFLMLSTKVGHTPFKKALAQLKPEDGIKTSHPAGTFILDEKSPAIFIAGGIGITPFRSMIKYAFDQKLSTPITLIYSNSDANFPFKKELDSWQNELNNLTIHFINTTTQGRLDKEKLISYQLSVISSIFYLAGPPKMVDSFEKMLIDSGVDKTNIRYDHFDGY